MERNNETIRLAKKAADAWRDTDTYHQAAQIIDMLISALEGDPTLPQPSNEALTLEELREMDGEPVWVQTPGIPKYGCWVIVAGVDTEYGQRTLYCQGDYTCRNYGRDWIAYRRPPEGELKYDGRL